MNSIIVKPKTEKEYSLVMEMLKKMRIKTEPVKDDDLYPTMTQEELDERIQKSIDGPTASPSKVTACFAKWRNAE